MSAFMPVVILGMILLIIVVLSSTAVIILKILKGGASPKEQKAKTDEAKMIQEIYQGLARMEERVESLETILLERERAGKEQKNEGI